MSLIREIDIEPPRTAEDGSHKWTRLQDMSPLSSKGKGRVGLQGKPEVMAVIGTGPQPEGTASLKRRREDSPVEGESTDNRPIADAQLRHYDAASHVVADFLRGPPLPPEEGEEPRQPPTNKRRLRSPGALDSDVPHLAIPPLAERQRSNESNTSEKNTSGSGLSSDGRTLSTGTAETSPTETPVESGLVEPALALSPAPGPVPSLDMGRAAYTTNDFVPAPPTNTAARDPFGYMSSGPSAPPPAVFTGFRAFSSSTGPVNMFGRPLAPPGMPGIPGVPGNPFASAMPMTSGSFGLPPHGLPGALAGLAPARPVHPHAYVTVGAGMRQKEVDMYSAENPLPGVSPVSGATEDGLVPYYVPM